MREALRNIWRRKVRSALTIFGVAIGIFALTTMGSLAASLNESIKVGLDYYSTRVVMGSKTGGFGGIFSLGPQVPESLAQRAALVEGVERAYPQVVLNGEEDGSPSFTSTRLVLGSPPAESDKDPSKLEVKEGRRLTDQDRGKVVIGANIAGQDKLDVGNQITVLGKPFEVVGVLEFLNSDPDSYYIVHINDARDIMRTQNQFALGASELVTNIQVIPDQGADTTALAKRLDTTFPGTQSTPPEELKKQIEQASSVLNLVVLGSALVAVLVGSLSVINTMMVSVGERRKEIGIKRVVGAKGRHLLKEVVLETMLIGLIGGLVGLGAGAILVQVINANAKNTGFSFSLTPELAASALGFAIFLGIVAGLYPAWRALRIKPVEVLREE